MRSRFKESEPNSLVAFDHFILLNEIGFGFLNLFDPLLELTANRFIQKAIPKKIARPLKKTEWIDLPAEMQLTIFSYLDPMMLITAEEVSLTLNELMTRNLDQKNGFFLSGGYEIENKYLNQRCKQIRQHIKELEPTFKQKLSYFFLPPYHGRYRRHLENEREAKASMVATLSLVMIAICVVTALAFLAPLGITLIAGIVSFSAFYTGIFSGISNLSMGLAYPGLLKGAKQCEAKQSKQVKLENEIKTYQGLRMDAIEERQQKFLNHSLFAKPKTADGSLAKENFKLFSV